MQGGVQHPEEGVPLQAQRPGPVCEGDAETQACGQGPRLGCEHLQERANSQIKVSRQFLEEKVCLVLAANMYLYTSDPAIYSSSQ